MASVQAIEVLLAERRRLIGRLEQEEEQLETLRSVVEELADRVARGKQALAEINSVLGKEPQLRLDQADVRLRGQRLEQIAIEILSTHRDGQEPVHYREWFELLRSNGYLVAGKEPLDTFLAQINRSTAVERVGRRTGLYRLAD